MPELQYPWPKNSWTILSKIIRAWYSVETSGGEVTQKRIAQVAGVQQSQVSTNKSFLQALGIISPEGTSLTDAGKRVGIGFTNENESMTRQGLEQVIKGNPLLKGMLDIVRGRGGLKINDFYDEIALRIGGRAEGFVTGTAILVEILERSGAVEIKDNILRPSREIITEQPPQLEKEKNSLPKQPSNSGLNRIPIAVSTNSVWWIEVGEKPTPEEVQKFLEMQKLMFG
ncbi:MAG: hypothetical protein WBL63_05460 [Candidatus Acidiferrum sp.]